MSMSKTPCSICGKWWHNIPGECPEYPFRDGAEPSSRAARCTIDWQLPTEPLRFPHAYAQHMEIGKGAYLTIHFNKDGLPCRIVAGVID